MPEHSADMLALTGVRVRFGGVEALAGADFVIPRGAIASLIGPNGAGKTTLLNAITGMVGIAEGDILLDGRDVSRLPPHKRARAGVVRTFQNLEIFSNMTVLENVMAGRHRLTRYSIFDSLLKTPRFFRGERACRDAAMEKLEFVGLAGKKDHPAGDLPYGSQRLLEMARALAAEPKLILLDEPAAGLNTKETRALSELILTMRDRFGVSIGLVEHDMDLVMEISDRVTVLNFGAVIAAGTPAEIQRNPEVIAAYLGD